MKVVLQRVSLASVAVAGEVTGSIGFGLLALVGVETGDTESDLEFILRKILNLRVFDDSDGKMNRSLLEVGGAVLLISQFTLLGDCRKGNRPGFSRAAVPESAQALYRLLADRIRDQGIQVATGRFQSRMQVALVNEGPVTLIVDSRR